MTELQNLKEECLQKQKTVEELNGSLCEKIILRDINILKKNDSTIMSGSDRNKFYKDKLIITVTSKGMLEIEDRRGSAFLWGFEIQHDKDFRLYNIFELDRNVYDVNYIKESEVTERMLNKIKEVIAEFNNSISILKSDIPLDTWKYKYYDAHEDVTCNSLQEVFETVLKRKY